MFAPSRQKRDGVFRTMTRIDSHPPIDAVSLSRKLDQLFAIGTVRSVSLVHGWYMSQNLRIETDSGIYFLKQYRNRLSSIVHEIKRAETYFAGEGIPVILPIPDRFGRSAFWLEGNWFSLFPFVEGKSPEYGKIPSSAIRSLGRMLAELHRAGMRYPKNLISPIRLWDKESFRVEIVELEQELLSRPALDAVEQRVFSTLLRKAELVEKNALTPTDFALPFDCLLHGDFIYQNTFVSGEGAITHVFDLEKACVGPRAYELARSLLVCCFDDGWTDENVAHGTAFLDAYRSAFSIAYDEFEAGMRMYATNLFHMTWIEARFVLFNNDESMPIYERHARRVDALGGDIGALCGRLYRTD